MVLADLKHHITTYHYRWRVLPVWCISKCFGIDFKKIIARSQPSEYLGYKQKARQAFKNNSLKTTTRATDVDNSHTLQLKQIQHDLHLQHTSKTMYCCSYHTASGLS